MGWLTGQIPRGPDKGESHTLTHSFSIDLQGVPRTAWSGMWVGIARDFLRHTRSSVVCEERTSLQTSLLVPGGDHPLLCPGDATVSSMKILYLWAFLPSEEAK